MRLDTALWILGNPRSLTVSAYTADYYGKSPVYARQASGGTMRPEDFDVEDFGVAFVRPEGDAVLAFKISWAMHFDSLGHTFFLGTEGGLDLDAMRLYHDQYGVGVATELPRRETSWTEQFRQKVAAFVETVRDGGPAPIPGEEILPATAVLEAIYRLAAERAEVPVEIPPL
jgi:predicted dehydrogenase